MSYSDEYDDRFYSNAIQDEFRQQGFSASLTLSVPLYSGGGVSASAREANYLYIEQYDNTIGVIQDVAQETRSAYLSLIADVTAVTARKSAITSNQSALIYAQSGYAEGLRTIIDVVNAQKATYQANQSYADAIYDYFIVCLKLKEVTGSLSFRDVDELS